MYQVLACIWCVVNVANQRMVLMVVMVAMVVMGAMETMGALAAAPGDSHCTRLLRLASPPTGKGEPNCTSSSGSLEWVMDGVPEEVVMQWEEGEGAAARAHAALAAALARRLGYGRVRVRARARAGRRAAACAVAARAAAVRPRLHVRLSRPRGCLEATLWSFYAHEHNLRNCDFLRMADLGPAWAQYERMEGEGEECSECAVVVAGRGAVGEARALARRARARALRLRVVRGDALRLPPGAANRSLLLLEEPLWAHEPHVHVVYAPPCDDPPGGNCSLDLDYLTMPTTAECSINIMRYAPVLARLVKKFVPTAADIRNVLELESVNENDIEEAACQWLLRNLNRTDNRFLDTNVRYRIRLFLCREDADHADYQQISTDILKATNLTNLSGLSFEIKNQNIDCLKEDAFQNEYIKYIDKIDEQGTIGWVGTGVGLSKIEQQARKISLPIVSYGAPSTALRPNELVRGVAGSALVLARALRHLWAQCGFQRIAVISDRTAYSHNFVSLIGEDLNIRQANVTSAESIRAALKQFREADARVYFVNTDEATATRVVCAAMEAGMADERQYAWVAREWSGRGGCAAPPVLGVALAWRGAEGARGWAPPGAGAAASAVRATLDARYGGRAWPPLAAPLADALQLLTHSLLAFLHRHPESKFDRHAFGNMSNYVEAVRATHVGGMTQNLQYNDTDFELESSMAFVERWAGGRRRVVAAWRLRRGAGGGVEEALPPLGALCPAYVRDAAVCFTTFSGDRFAPSCHDLIWILLAVVVLAAPLMLYYARRARLHGLKLRDLALLQQLTEQRKVSSPKFASQLVSRSEFELREEVGSGAHGRVRVAVLRRPRHPPLAVAAKEAAERCLQDEADLIREACVLSSLKHENIISLLGVCLDGPALFFMEYAFFGDLRNYLRARRSLAEFACRGTQSGCPPEGHDVAEATHVSAPALTQLARHAAAALDYLSKQRIVHRDVRAANCLIDETRTLKLADFGLARTLSDEEAEYTNQHWRRLPIACMAPESLTNGVFSTASDVWGLGVLMLELVTLGAPPYGDSGPTEIMSGVRAGVHPPLPPAANALTCELLTQCWRVCASERPSAAELAAFLQSHGAALAPAFVRPYSDAGDVYDP